MRQQITYSPNDLLLCEWGAAVLIDSDCGETLQIVEFANVQLLEFRFIDRRLDDRLEAAYQLLHPPGHSWLPLWRTHERPLRALGEMKIDANALFERTSSALRLVGDQYLARVYRLLATRFHLDEWERNIRQSLEVAQGVYQVLSDQATSYRTELLEIIVVILILVGSGARGGAALGNHRVAAATNIDKVWSPPRKQGSRPKRPLWQFSLACASGS